jgi:hypothetical protein
MKKFGLSVIILCLTFSLKAQERSDIGLVFSQDDAMTIGFEWRFPQKNKWRWTTGILAGNTYSPYSFTYDDIIAVTDTSIIERNYRNSSEHYTLRFGGEYQIKSTMFSIGADANMSYESEYNYHFNSVTYYNVDDPVVSHFHSDYEAIDYAHIRRHFINPSFRLSFIMNVPLGDHFTLSLSAAARIGTQIYMGASQIEDPLNEFIGTPPSILNMTTGANIGIRYNLGSIKKKKEVKEEG